MKSYLDILDNTLSNGKWKESDTGPVLSYFGESFRHHMSYGFPLITTNEIPVELAWAGLEGLIHGVTSPNLGPIDGYQWRKFNQSWNENKDEPFTAGVDQLKRVIDTLKKNPSDPTLLCTSWNPAQLDRMELKPYRILWNVTVSDNELNLAWYQRSAEIARGLPLNIALYATLLLLLAESTGRKAGVLHGTFADCYISESHIDDAEEQTKRSPLKLPIVTTGLGDGSLLKWSRKDATVHGYSPHPRLNFSPISM